MRRLLHLRRQIEQQRPESDEQQKGRGRSSGASAADPGQRRKGHYDQVDEERGRRLPPDDPPDAAVEDREDRAVRAESRKFRGGDLFVHGHVAAVEAGLRSEEHTSELQSQSISYAVFCLKKKKK